MMMKGDPLEDILYRMFIHVPELDTSDWDVNIALVDEGYHDEAPLEYSDDLSDEGKLTWLEAAIHRETLEYLRSPKALQRTPLRSPLRSPYNPMNTALGTLLDSWVEKGIIEHKESNDGLR
jgi:hypothetical protein